VKFFGCVIFLLCTIGFSQAPAQFEVTSVKPNNSGSGYSRSSSQPDGGYIATNTTLRGLILSAYLVRRFQVVGGPDWIDSDRFDVAAKAPENSTEDQYPQMLQALLAERFKLVVHAQTQEQPIYAIGLGRRDGSLGPQLKRAAKECSRPATQTSYTSAGGKVRGTCTPLSELAASLFGAVNRMVVDQTGLMGVFDFELQWTSEGSQLTDAPSLFTALQEQLGLKFESSRGLVEMLVVDKVERPSPN
jgi:uncharacterized protein (TIGR03435 family)